MLLLWIYWHWRCDKSSGSSSLGSAHRAIAICWGGSCAKPAWSSSSHGSRTQQPPPWRVVSLLGMLSLGEEKEGRRGGGRPAAFNCKTSILRHSEVGFSTPAVIRGSGGFRPEHRPGIYRWRGTQGRGGDLGRACQKVQTPAQQEANSPNHGVLGLKSLLGWVRQVVLPVV